MKHTPGPWVNIGTYVGTAGLVVESTHVANVIPRRNTEEQEANAHLIAAVPEMLAILKDIERFLHYNSYNTDMVNSIIAKAEGKND